MHKLASVNIDVNDGTNVKAMNITTIDDSLYDQQFQIEPELLSARPGSDDSFRLFDPSVMQGKATKVATKANSPLRVEVDDDAPVGEIRVIKAIALEKRAVRTIPPTKKATDRQRRKIILRKKAIVMWTSRTTICPTKTFTKPTTTIRNV